MFPNSTQQPLVGVPPSNTNNSNSNYVTYPLLPPLGSSSANYYRALVDQIAGFQLKLFQDLFPIPVNPLAPEPAPGQGVSATLVKQDINSLKVTILAINQISTGVAPALRLPTGLALGTTTYANITGNSSNLNPLVIGRLNDMWVAVDQGSWTRAYALYQQLRDTQLQAFYRWT